MKRFLCKTLCVFLSLAMLCGASVTAFAADGQSKVLTACGGACAYCPTILIPGNFQSPTRVLDDDGNAVDCPELRMSLYGDISPRALLRYAARLAIPLTLTIALQTDAGLSKTVKKVMAEVFQDNVKDNEGRHVRNIEAVRYPHALAQYTAEEKAPIYDSFPLDEFIGIAGEDHLYFFSYDSLGSVSELADELYAFIQNVKRESGHARVNLLPCSQGATIAGAMIERYREEMTADLHRVVLAIPALDGTYLVGKIFNNGMNKQDGFVYRDMFPSLLGDTASAYALNLAIRLLPKSAVHRTLDGLVEALRPVIANASCMWALIPASEYDAAYARYMTDGTREKVREDVEFVHRAQANARDNLLYLKSRGVEVFDLVDYGLTMYPLFEGWEAYNADNMIQLESTSGGAVSCPVTETLPETYVQNNTYCTCGGSHISPDRRVDASAGFLCETTFYFADGKHEVSAFNDVFIRLATALLTDDDFHSVHTYPDRYPQFNTTRYGSYDVRNVIADVRENVDFTSLSDTDAAELTAAIEECESLLSQTVVDAPAFEQAKLRLDAILVKIGFKSPPAEPSAFQTRSAEVMHRISDRVFQTFGGRGFSDVLLFRYRG